MILSSAGFPWTPADASTGPSKSTGVLSLVTLYFKVMCIVSMKRQKLITSEYVNQY